MKRRNVQMAFVGEGTESGDDAVDQLVDGDEAVDIEVKGGKLMVVVPAGTPDEQIFEAAQTLGGELVLENGMRLSFTLEDAAVAPSTRPAATSRTTITKASARCRTSPAAPDRGDWDGSRRGRQT